MGIARIIAALLALTTCAWGQGAVLQGGPFTPGHIPVYVGQGSTQPVIMDGGAAGGGTIGVGATELLITATGTGTPPFAAQGTGPLGTNACMYDAPIDNATGYHYLCLSANAQGGALLAVGSGGAASALPLSFIVNGVTYDFPFSTGGGIVGPDTTVVGNLAVWDDTTGTALADFGFPPVTLAGTNTWTGVNTFSTGIIVPTRADADDTQNAASTAFVQNIFDLAHSWALTQTFSSILVPTRSPGDGTTNAASTAFVSTGIANIFSTINTFTVQQNFTGNVSIGSTAASSDPLLVSANSGAIPSTISGTMVRFAGANASSSRMLMDAWGTDIAAVVTGRGARGTAQVPTATQSGDLLMGVSARGFGATVYGGAVAGVLLSANQNFTDSAQGSRIGFFTTPNASTTQAERLRVENDGGITIPPTVTGGNQGPGTINAAGLFINGVGVGTGAGSVTDITCNGGLTGGLITTSGTCAADIASGANFMAATANKLLDAAAPYVAETATSYGATTTFDFSTFINTAVTLTGNITTVTLSNMKANQSGVIRFIQDATGGRTIPPTVNANLKCPGGCNYVLSTAPNAIDALPYACIATNYCIGGALLQAVQ